MSTTNHKQGRNVELQRRRALQTAASILTPDNYDILLTGDSVTTIANKISEMTGKKMMPTEIDSLIKFISMLPPDRYFTLSLDASQTKIAGQFLTKYQSMAKNFSEESNIEKRIGLNNLTDGPGTLR